MLVEPPAPDPPPAAQHVEVVDHGLPTSRGGIAVKYSKVSSRMYGDASIPGLWSEQQVGEAINLLLELGELFCLPGRLTASRGRRGVTWDAGWHGLQPTGAGLPTRLST